MKIAISGSTGLVGSALSEVLRSRGDEVVPMTRPSTDGPKEGTIPWDPAAGTLDPVDLEGVDAVVHLAGESIAGGAWTSAKKKRILDSRVLGTSLVAESIAACEDPPAVLVSASAIGLYGDRGDETLDESSAPGDGFLADVCREWESSADPAREAGVRVVHPRIGLVLAREGGLLERMLLPFRLGLGGRLGDGRQWMSWVTLRDLVAILAFALVEDDLAGPVNAVGPAPVRNAEFTKTLAAELHRPAILPAPAFALKLLPGDMGDELLLASTRVRSAVLEEQGFSWQDPSLESALDAILGEPA